MKLRSSIPFEIGVTRVISQPLENFDLLLPSGIRMNRLKENPGNGAFRLPESGAKMLSLG